MQASSLAGWVSSLLFVILTSSAVVAQQPAPRKGRSAVGILRVRSLYEVARFKGVHKEIGLTDFTKLDALRSDYRDAVNEEQRAAGIDPEITKQLKGAERIAKLTEFRLKAEEVTKRVNAQFDGKLKDALTPAQYARVKEIFVQMAGADALVHGEVAKDLELSEEQKKKFDAIQAEWNKAESDLLLSGAARDPAGTLIKKQEKHEQMLKKATDELTAQQKKKLEELKGKPFDFSQIGSGR